MGTQNSGRTRTAKTGRRKDRSVLIREYAYTITSRFIYSEKALLQKLHDRYPEDTGLIEDIVVELKENRFIDDGKNSRFLADVLVKKGYGPRYIRQTLLRKGFSPEDGLLAGNTTEALDKWFNKKVKTGRLSPKETAKMFRYLKSKGFYTEDILDYLRKRGVYAGQ